MNHNPWRGLLLPDDSLTGPNTVLVLLVGNVDSEVELVAIIGGPGVNRQRPGVQ